MPSTSFRHIVRIAGIDIDGNLKIPYGLLKIKGVGYNLALMICRVLGLDPNLRIGYLTDDDIKKVESVLSNPLSYGLKPFLLNRRKDYESGKDFHLIGSDLIFVVKQDIEREIKIKSWRGVRHSLGLKVRGQRTHTTGRTGITVGVSRRK